MPNLAYRVVRVDLNGHEGVAYRRGNRLVVMVSDKLCDTGARMVADRLLAAFYASQTSAHHQGHVAS